MRPILLYDGTCGLCDRSVRFVRARDGGRFRFEPLQGAAGQRHLVEAGLPRDYFDSLVVIDEAGTHTHSDGALRIARQLRWPWRALVTLRVVPRPVRDWAYGLVARWRYRIFGRVDACRLDGRG